MFFLSGIDNKIKIKTYYQNSSVVSYKINYDTDNSYIEDIDFNYRYNSLFNENMNGYYKYNVLAYLYVYENNIDDVIWFRKYDLTNDKIVNLDNEDSLEIKDEFKLDFQKYSKEINKFKDEQEKELSGYLNIQVNFIESLDINNKLNNNIKNRKININVPITSENLKIDVDNILVKDSYYNFNRHSIMNFVLVTLSMLCFSIAIALLALIIRQFRFINERQKRYSSKVKKILSKYDYCIVKVNKLYVNKKYNMIYVSSFDELLDVYNTRNIMINFKEVKRGMESIFVIIDSNDAWIYRLTTDNLD